MSNKRKTTFKPSMLDGNDALGDAIQNWAKPVNGDCFSVRCLLCRVNINISLRGHAQLVRHPSNQMHKSRRKDYLDDNGKLKKIQDNQQDMFQFLRPSDSTEVGWKQRSLDDNVAFAEAVWCTCTAVNNLPFQVANHVSDMMPVMFPDSAIAKSFHCKQNKTSYAISDGLGPLFHARIENDIRNKALVYSIQVDEATTAKHWRQFDVIVKYWPFNSEQVLVQHLKSFSMGHANAQQLENNILDALSGLYHENLLQLSSDGPNVMKALQKKAIQDINKDIVDIGTCNIHKTHNAFSAAFEAFDSSIETLGLEIFQCFKYSAAKREDYESAQAKVKVKAHFFLRHVESRWTTLEDVVVRLAEQLPALKQYFLKDLSDREKESGRVKKICQILQDKLILAEMFFIKSVLELFSRITRMFQSSEPLIHVLYDEMNTLVLTLMRRCLTPEAIDDKSGKDLYKVDLEKKENWLKEVNIGESAKTELKKLKDSKKISDASYSSFFRRAKKLYHKGISELLRTFPLKNSLLCNLQVLHPLARKSEKSRESIKQVAIKIKAFPREEIDKLSDEWSEYMSEEIPEEWYCISETNNDCDEEEEGAAQSDQVIKYERIDMYWGRVGKMTRSTGERKYPILMKLARIALTLNHGNADVERGFSKNNLLLTSHRTRLDMPAINGLRTVSSYVSKYESDPHKLPFSKDIANSIRSSHASYEERKKKEREVLKKKRDDEDRDKSVSEEREMHDLLKKKERSEALLKEGMSMLDEAMKMKNKGYAMTKAEAANAIIQNARKALDDVQNAISKHDFQRKKKRKT